MDAINLQGIWPNFAGAGVTPPAPAPTRRRGASNYAWKATLAAWRKQREEEEEAERKRREKELERLVGRRRAMELQAAVEQAQTEEACLVAALIGDDYEF